MYLDRLWRSVPLMTTIGGILFFVAGLSPVTWSSGLSTRIFIMAGLISIVCAYSTTMYLDDRKTTAKKT